MSDFTPPVEALAYAPQLPGEADLPEIWPDPLPVVLLGRLAIDLRNHNKGPGRALLRDAMLWAVHIASDTGVFAIMLHALPEQAKRFYL